MIENEPVFGKERAIQDTRLTFFRSKSFKVRSVGSVCFAIIGAVVLAMTGVWIYWVWIAFPLLFLVISEFTVRMVARKTMERLSLSAGSTRYVVDDALHVFRGEAETMIAGPADITGYIQAKDRVILVLKGSMYCPFYDDNYKQGGPTELFDWLKGKGVRRL